MRYLFISTIIMGVLLACGDGGRPKGVLSRKEMVHALCEVYLNEEKTNRINLQRDSALQVFDKLQQKTFEQLGITDSVFKKSLNYYWSRPDEMEQVFGIVIDSLNLREQRMSLSKEP